MRFSRAHVIGAIAIAAAVAAGIYRSSVHAVNFADDFDVICAAASVLERGGDPYALTAPAEMASPALPMTYPPLTAIAMQPVCGAIAPLWLVVPGVLLLAAFASRLPGVRPAPAAWAVLSACAAFPWLLLTGNVLALAEGFCGAAVVWAIFRNRPFTFGAALGVAVFLKLTPAAYLIAAFVRWPARMAAAATGTAAGVFAALQIVTYAVAAEAFGQYWTAVGAGWNGFIEAEVRFGTENNPSPFSFLPIAASYIGATPVVGSLLALALAVAFAVAWLRLWRAQSPSEEARAWLTVLALAVIAITSPRFKPYTIVFLLPAVAMVLSRLRGARLTVAMILVCLLPNAALLALTWIATAGSMPVPIVFGLQYAQWVLAACALALALRPAAFRHVSQPAAVTR